MQQVAFFAYVLLATVGCCFAANASQEYMVNCHQIVDFGPWPAGSLDNIECYDCPACERMCTNSTLIPGGKARKYAVCVPLSADEQPPWLMRFSFPPPALHTCWCTDLSPKQRTETFKKHCVALGYATATCKLNACECHYTPELSEEHRAFVVEKQNSFRSHLALGQAVNKDGTTLPNATNMIKLKYNTTLEWYGRRWASRCILNYRFDVDEVLGNIYFHQRGKLEREKALRNLASRSWALLKRRGIDRNKLSVNVDGDMASWAQMMWHNASQVGCGVYYCKGINQTLVNCVYDKAYDWGAMAYQPGTPCSGKGCTSCDKTMGLCELSEPPPDKPKGDVNDRLKRIEIPTLVSSTFFVD